MNTIHFYLEKRKVSGIRDISRECPIILSCSYSSKRIKIYTGLKIRESAWDFSLERAQRIFADSLVINNYLDVTRERVSKYIQLKNESRQKLDLNSTKSEIKKLLKSKSPDFFELLLKFLEENSTRWSQSSYKKMKTFYLQMKTFSEEQLARIQLSDVNQQFADKLVAFYRNNGLQDTTIKKNLELLRWFMNWGLKEGFVHNRDYEKIRFEVSPIKEIRNIYFLKWDELISFFDCRNLTKKEEWSRDIFCFIAFSGMRFSKLTALKKINFSYPFIVNDDSKKSKIHLNPFALEILRKYENKYYKSNTLFPSMSIITFLKHLKSGARKAGLERMLFPENNNYYPIPLSEKISAQLALNTYIAHSLRLGNTSIVKKNDKSAVSLIRTISGVYEQADEKQKAISEQLYESIRNTGKSAAQLL